MTNLTVQIGDKNIGLVLPEGSISIAIQNSLVTPLAEPAKPAQLEWSGTLLDGESVNYKSAEKAVSALGEGWRIPTRFELESLLDLTRYDPAFDASKHPHINIKSKYYWTATPYKPSEDTAVWVVGFGSGYVNGSNRGNGACVLAVRSSQ